MIYLEKVNLSKIFFLIILECTVVGKSFANDALTLICEDKKIRSVWINVWVDKYQQDAQLIRLGTEYNKMYISVLAKKDEPIKISVSSGVSIVQGQVNLAWQFNFFIKAGDTVYVKQDSQDENKALIFNIKNKPQLFSEINFDYLLYKAAKHLKKETLMDIASLKQYFTLRENLLDSLLNKKNISDSFYHSIADEKQFLLHDRMLSYFKAKYFIVPEDSLANIPLFEDSLLAYNGYLKYCTNYINAMHVYNKKDQKILFPFTSFFNWCLQNGKGMTREKLLLQSLLQINVYEKSNFIDCYKNYRKINTNNEADFYLKNLIVMADADKDFSNNNLTITDQLQDANSNSKITLADLLRKNQGKLIYIDFWASWCAPCIAEMSYYKSLRQQISDDQIVFVFVSIDESFSEWKMANERNLPEEKNSYLLINAKSSKFIKLYNVFSIPRYFLYNKNGQLINSDALRPSSKRLLNELKNELIQK